MNILIRTLNMIVVIALISSCSMLDSFTSSSSRMCARDNGEFYECKDFELKKSNVARSKISTSDNSFNSNINFPLLSDYTEQMSMEMKKNVRGVIIDKVIAVSSFVYLDENLQSTNELGNQLAEYFLTDLQKIGLPMADHKVTAYLDVSYEGDFTLSRDIDELNPDLEIGYVLAGTMIPNKQGIVINARIINKESGRVIASTSKLLPNIVVNRVM